MRAEKSVGSAIASSSALVCNDWVWPSAAANSHCADRLGDHLGYTTGDTFQDDAKRTCLVQSLGIADDLLGLLRRPALDSESAQG